MSVVSERAVKRRAGYRALGLCRNGAGHGPATDGTLCSPCRSKRRALEETYKHSEDVVGMCSISAYHGPAAAEGVCERCYRAVLWCRTRVYTEEQFSEAARRLRAMGVFDE
jgi:hypothetical protein